MEYRRAALPSTELEAEAVAELARKVQLARVRVLLPAVVLGASLGFVSVVWFFDSELGAVLLEATRWHRYWAGGAVACAFGIPCGSIVYIGRVIYRRRLAQVRSRWIDDGVARLGLDRETMEGLATVFE